MADPVVTPIVAMTTMQVLAATFKLSYVVGNLSWLITPGFVTGVLTLPFLLVGSYFFTKFAANQVVRGGEAVANGVLRRWWNWFRGVGLNVVRFWAGVVAVILVIPVCVLLFASIKLRRKLRGMPGVVLPLMKSVGRSAWMFKSIGVFLNAWIYPALIWSGGLEYANRMYSMIFTTFGATGGTFGLLRFAVERLIAMGYFDSSVPVDMEKHVVQMGTGVQAHCAASKVQAHSGLVIQFRDLAQRIGVGEVNGFLPVGEAVPVGLGGVQAVQVGDAKQVLVDQKDAPNGLVPTRVTWRNYVKFHPCSKGWGMAIIPVVNEEGRELRFACRREIGEIAARYLGNPMIVNVVVDSADADAVGGRLQNAARAAMARIEPEVDYNLWSANRAAFPHQPTWWTRMMYDRRVRTEVREMPIVVGIPYSFSNVVTIALITGVVVAVLIHLWSTSDEEEKQEAQEASANDLNIKVQEVVNALVTTNRNQKESLEMLRDEVHLNKRQLEEVVKTTTWIADAQSDLKSQIQSHTAATHSMLREPVINTELIDERNKERDAKLAKILEQNEAILRFLEDTRKYNEKKKREIEARRVAPVPAPVAPVVPAPVPAVPASVPVPVPEKRPLVERSAAVAKKHAAALEIISNGDDPQEHIFKKGVYKQCQCNGKYLSCGYHIGGYKKYLREQMSVNPTLAISNGELTVVMDETDPTGVMWKNVTINTRGLEYPLTKAITERDPERYRDLIARANPPVVKEPRDDQVIRIHSDGTATREKSEGEKLCVDIGITAHCEPSVLQEHVDSDRFKELPPEKQRKILDYMEQRETDRRRQVEEEARQYGIDLRNRDLEDVEDYESESARDKFVRREIAREKAAQQREYIRENAREAIRKREAKAARAEAEKKSSRASEGYAERKARGVLKKEVAKAWRETDADTKAEYDQKLGERLDAAKAKYEQEVEQIRMKTEGGLTTISGGRTKRHVEEHGINASAPQFVSVSGVYPLVVSHEGKDVPVGSCCAIVNNRICVNRHEVREIKAKYPECTLMYVKDMIPGGYEKDVITEGGKREKVTAYDYALVVANGQQVYDTADGSAPHLQTDEEYAVETAKNPDAQRLTTSHAEIDWMFYDVEPKYQQLYAKLSLSVWDNRTKHVRLNAVKYVGGKKHAWQHVSSTTIVTQERVYIPEFGWVAEIPNDARPGNSGGAYTNVDGVMVGLHCGGGRENNTPNYGIMCSKYIWQQVMNFQNSSPPKMTQPKTSSTTVEVSRQ